MTLMEKTTNSEFRFLLAKLQLDSLTDKFTPNLMKRALQQLPRGSEALDEAYRLAMQRIESQKTGCAKLARRILAWLTFTKRQLSVLELQHAMAVDNTVPNLDEDNLLDVDDMASVCAGLVTIDHESHVIRLVHYTTLTYLRRYFHMEAHVHHEDIAMTCLIYLSFETFTGGHCLTYEELGKRLRKNPFLVYAAKYWGVHACATTKGNELEETAMSFLEDRPKLACSIQALHVLDNDSPRYSQVIPSNTTAVHLAAYLGFEWILTSLIQRSYPPDSPDAGGRTPLLYAAGNGHEKIVELLLERDDVRADFHSSKTMARLCGTPLSFASWCGQETVVELLVNRKDVNVNFKMTEGTTPLMRASLLGHEKVVQLLLKREDIDVNSKSDSKRTALSLAAQIGHDAVVKLLLEHKGIEADCENSKHEDCPLIWAASSGHEKVVKLLADRPDVDVNSTDFNGISPLGVAAAEGHEAVVKLLLEQVDINADSRDSTGGTPLSAAATQGHEAIVSLLIDRDDVNIDSRDDKGYTPISWAAALGHRKIVELLADRDDVDVDSRDNIGRSVLTWTVCSTLAQSREVKELAAFFVERDDVDADHKDDQGRTPLSWAASRSSASIREDAIAVVELLAKRDDVDVDSKDVDGWTPYGWAVQAGNHEIAKLLESYSQRSPPPYMISSLDLDGSEPP